MSTSPRAVVKRTAALPAALTIGCQAVEGSAAPLSGPKGSGAAVLENGFASPAADLASPCAEPPSSSTLSEMTPSRSVQMESPCSLAVRPTHHPCLCLGASKGTLYMIDFMSTSDMQPVQRLLTSRRESA